MLSFERGTAADHISITDVWSDERAHPFLTAPSLGRYKRHGPERPNYLITTAPLPPRIHRVSTQTKASLSDLDGSSW